MWDGELQEKLATATLIMRRMEQKLVAFAQLAERSLVPRMYCLPSWRLETCSQTRR